MSFGFYEGAKFKEEKVTTSVIQQVFNQRDSAFEEYMRCPSGGESERLAYQRWFNLSEAAAKLSDYYL